MPPCTTVGVAYCIEPCYFYFLEESIRRTVRSSNWLLRTSWGDALAVMPAYVKPSSQLPYTGFGVKMIAIIPSNPDRGLDAHVDMVLVLDETGLPRASWDGATIIAVRTAAVSAVGVTKTVAAAAGADIICTVTARAQLLLDADHVMSGAHINAVGSSFPNRRELTGELVARYSIFVDSRRSPLPECGDIWYSDRARTAGSRGDPC